ncbi:glycoside hydrolase family 99-like domain-containing protein [Segatella paludivivens]|uniref:glycoside hydrolase family 99-like domain-containing protein n=1 Tax=Segatella paludivivens TaxID=185294 RepID=UPI0003805EFD|nr:glycoside hydrolase family 99-like domain-containing protein [Segatella paludivivens]
MNKKARVIAYYLPQYHPIPENDKYWGKGFTEWTNVGKAKPLFKGHYQPRVPADLGYYDLRNGWVREQQAELAKSAGIEGFCYWHYWFGNGKELLEQPFNEVVDSGSPDFPFCLGWANHDWATNTWTANGNRKEIIAKMDYPGEKDYILHFDKYLKAFKDKRYIKVDNKLLFVIYAPMDMPDFEKFKEKWNELALKNGLNGFHFVGMTTGWTKNYQKVLEMGLDAITPSNLWYAETKVNGYFKKMLTHKLRQLCPWLSPLNKYKYKDIIKFLFNDYDRMECSYPSIVPNWDRSPRSGRNAVIYTGSTPELFKKHVIEALEIVKNKKPEHRILFLRSWNEWGEGNYMEPDLKFGHKYLDTLKEIIG